MPQHELEPEELPGRFRRRSATGPPHEGFHGKMRELLLGLSHRREPEARVAGAAGVVEAEDRELVRNADADLLRNAHDLQGAGVIDGDDGGRPAVTEQHIHKRHGGAADHDRLAVPAYAHRFRFQPGERHRLGIAQLPVAGVASVRRI
jgi:hypothetical protein